MNRSVTTAVYQTWKNPQGFLLSLLVLLVGFGCFDSFEEYLQTTTTRYGCRLESGDGDCLPNYVCTRKAESTPVNRDGTENPFDGECVPGTTQVPGDNNGTGGSAGAPGDPDMGADTDSGGLDMTASGGRIGRLDLGSEPRQDLTMCDINNERDGDETGIDCGGPDCESCPSGMLCELDQDCQSSRCVAGLCAQACSADTECSGATDYCSDQGVCQMATCEDNVQNGNESDVDCGGADCSLCTDEKLCTADSDCASNYCHLNNRCQTPNCTDGVMNGSEVGVDCGGECSACPECTSSEICNTPESRSNAGNNICSGGTCVCDPARDIMGSYSCTPSMSPILLCFGPDQCEGSGRPCCQLFPDGAQTASSHQCSESGTFIPIDKCRSKTGFSGVCVLEEEDATGQTFCPSFTEGGRFH